MPSTTTAIPDPDLRASCHLSAVEELEQLGWEINANQYRAVHLAARYESEHDWLRSGHPNAAVGIARRLQIHHSTAREWIRVGQALAWLPLIDAAFAGNEISYAKARILTRSATPDNEGELLEIASAHTASQLTTAIARHLVPDDEDADAWQHEHRSFTSHTNADGMTVIRIVLPPSTAKPVLAAVDALVTRIADTPHEPHSTERDSAERDSDPPADAPGRQSVTSSINSATQRGEDPPADASARRQPLAATLRELRRRWQHGAGDEWVFPSLAQQRADAFTVLFLDLGIPLTTEVVIHVRGDGNTFDDGTPITSNAITAQLDDAFIRLLLHDAERRPIDASNRRRHPTARQKRVVSEIHGHACVDCGESSLIEFDHLPPFSTTGHTITTELEPRCAPCHRQRHAS